MINTEQFSPVLDSIDSKLKEVSNSAGKLLNIMPSSAGGFSLEAILCVAFCLSLMPISYFLTLRLVPGANKQYRYLFCWHAFDALTHLVVEGSFLYECFFSYANAYGREPHFLGHKGRIYGAAFGRWPSARLWQEYAKADHRWATAEPTVVSIELLTVLLGGPAAVYVCNTLWKIFSRRLRDNKSVGTAMGRMWTVATILATAELYGGFMTFAPEFLTGCTQLETGNLVYALLYLLFFNGLWVAVPIWVLREAWKETSSAYVALQMQRAKR